MKNFLSICAAILLFACMAVSSAAQESATDRDRLVGAWKLVELDQPGADGAIHSVGSSGMIVFTRDDHLSVQVMEREPEAHTGAAGPEQYSQGGYEASYGSYVVNETTHTFTFHIDGALVRSLIGKDLVRVYEFKGDQLIVKPARTDEHWRVIWQHYRAAPRGRGQ